MKAILDKHPYAVQTADDCARAIGVTPIHIAVRGGTDGSQISYMGIPTPNIFTGAMNYHGCMEFVSIQVLGKTLEMVRELVGRFIQ